MVNIFRDLIRDTLHQKLDRTCPMGYYSKPDSFQNDRTARIIISLGHFEHFFASCVPAPPGHYVNSQEATAPTQCSIGTYTDQAAQSSCLLAPAGSYVNSAGATAPTKCSAGTYTDQAGQSSCLLAPAGSYVNSAGASTPIKCNAGTYTDKEGQSTCALAPVGSYVNSAGASAPTKCRAGTYTNQEGQPKCTPAPSGSYVNSIGTESIKCSIGTYTDKPEQTTCLLVPAGSYVNSVGAAKPKPCQTGTYSDGDGSVACDLAPIGYYVPNAGATAPTPCSAGTYSSALGQSRCIEAMPGQYVNSSDRSYAQSCPANTYTDQPKQSQCIAAKNGGYLNKNVGATKYTPCPVGYYNPGVGVGNSELDSKACMPAPIGYYVDVPGATAPTKCPLGTHTDKSGQSKCTLVPPPAPAPFQPTSINEAVKFIFLGYNYKIAAKYHAAAWSELSKVPDSEERQLNDGGDPRVMVLLSETAIKALKDYLKVIDIPVPFDKNTAHTTTTFSGKHFVGSTEPFTVCPDDLLRANLVKQCLFQRQDATSNDSIFLKFEKQATTWAIDAMNKFLAADSQLQPTATLDEVRAAAAKNSAFCAEYDALNPVDIAYKVICSETPEKYDDLVL